MNGMGEGWSGRTKLKAHLSRGPWERIKRMAASLPSLDGGELLEGVVPIAAQT